MLQEDDRKISAVRTAMHYLNEAEKYLRAPNIERYKEIEQAAAHVALCFIPEEGVQRVVARTTVFVNFSPRAISQFPNTPTLDTDMFEEEIAQIRRQHVRSIILFLKTFLTDEEALPLEILTDSGFGEMDTVPRIDLSRVVAVAKQWHKSKQINQ